MRKRGTRKVLLLIKTTFMVQLPFRLKTKSLIIPTNFIAMVFNNPKPVNLSFELHTLWLIWFIQSSGKGLSDVPRVR